MHAHKVFVRYKKYGLRRSRDYEKKVWAGIAQTSYQAMKTQFFKFLVRLGAIYLLRT